MAPMGDIQEILKIVPHRYPMLMIDRIIELVPDERVVALKNVSINEPFFQGHFPGKPIMPGVLIIEAMAQAGGLLAHLSGFQKKGELIYFAALDKVKFRSPVYPGDQLISEMKVLKRRSRAMKISGIARVNETRVAEAEFLASLGENK